MALEHYVMLAVGAALVAAGALAWSGRWRSAGKDLMHPNWSFVLLPGLGVLVIGMGLEPLLGNAALGPALLLFMLSFVLFFWQPDWFGPRWWRERDRTDLGLDHGPNAMLAYFLKPGLGERGSLVTAERTMAPETPLAKLRAALVDERYGKPSAAQRQGVIEGYLLLYERGLVFAARPVEDKFRDAPTIVRLPAAAIRGCERLERKRVRIDSTEGPWVVETRQAGRLMAELGRRFGAADRAIPVSNA
jgi:hypothetical protein